MVVFRFTTTAIMTTVAIAIIARMMSPIATRTPTISGERVVPGSLGVTLRAGLVVAVTEGVGMAGNVFCADVVAAENALWIDVAAEGVVVAVERVAPGLMGVALCAGVVVAVIGGVGVITESVGVAVKVPSTLNWISADCSVPSILQVYVPESDS